MLKAGTHVVSGKNQFYYGWVIAVAAMFIYAIGSGQAVSFGIFIKPIAKELNWTRASLNGVFGLYILSMSISAFIFGILVDRVSLSAGFFVTETLALAGVGLLWIWAERNLR